MPTTVWSGRYASSYDQGGEAHSGFEHHRFPSIAFAIGIDWTSLLYLPRSCHLGLTTHMCVSTLVGAQ